MSLTFCSTGKFPPGSSSRPSLMSRITSKPILNGQLEIGRFLRSVGGPSSMSSCSDLSLPLLFIQADSDMQRVITDTMSSYHSRCALFSAHSACNARSVSQSGLTVVVAAVRNRHKGFIGIASVFLYLLTCVANIFVDPLHCCVGYIVGNEAALAWSRASHNRWNIEVR